MAASNQVDLTLQITHRMGLEPLRMDSLRYVNGDGELYSVDRLSYLLSGFVLESWEGHDVRMEGQFAWVDISSRRSLVHLHSIPKNRYKALRFSIGLTPTLNHARAHSLPPQDPLTPQLNGLPWNWSQGYIFLAPEGRWQNKKGELSGYSFHLAGDHNLNTVSLAQSLDLTESALCALEFDVNQLIDGPSSVGFDRDGRSTHSAVDDPLAVKLVGNLQSAWSWTGFDIVPDGGNRIKESGKPMDLPHSFTPYRLLLSRTFPVPPLPGDNPLIEERVALGEKLFNDKRLSLDGTIACSHCHQPAYAMGDGVAYSSGIDGRLGRRNAMPLFNLAWKSSFFWDGRSPSLRDQALHPIQDENEMNQSLEQMLEKLQQSSFYQDAFEAAYNSPEITSERVGLAIENFLLTKLSFDSKFDKSLIGQVQLTSMEKRGLELFMTEHEPRSKRFGADCFHCHGGPLFSDQRFHNNGLDDLSTRDLGRFQYTGRARDRGLFMTPSLRNIAVTGPYMHDGRFDTLEEVVAHYNEGLIRHENLDPNLLKHPPGGLGLSSNDQEALVAFLKTLTDDSFVSPLSSGLP